ncbi:porin family protein [Aliivibrio finisterrensis]|uniref:Porin family protein n=1 Tax=Aliivibrio finisterrensis TaxID=511998 RepID=A0A4Q5KH44_9GAMM|nr:MULTISPECIES: porin family protein [Aliivibrio]MDD9174450.1 porin family protein [Aliivibrio sp. S3TY1]MDD9191528.1 porin family protein [Aliivibrio sp. S2TY2]RYU45438.1 porin family protein [Aliivibrio finisterrensis]
MNNTPKFLLASLFTLALTPSVSASIFDDNEFSGHRVGGGYSNTDMIFNNHSLDYGDGIKLEYGYDINQIFGLNASYQNNNGSKYGVDLNSSALKVDSDIGYTFQLEGWSIKPYGAVGLARVNAKESFGSDNYSYKEMSLMGGMGARANFDMGLYTDLRYDFFNVDNQDVDQLSLTVGYRF